MAHIQATVQDQVHVITLNRSEARNAFDRAWPKPSFSDPRFAAIPSCPSKRARYAEPPPLAADQPSRSSSMYHATPAAMYQRWSACIGIGRMGVIGNGNSVAPVTRRARCNPMAVAAAMPRPL